MLRLSSIFKKAGLSPILYHTTSMFNLASILKDNKIHMVSNLGSGADQLYRQKKFRPYFFCFSRIKFGGFSQSVGEDGASTMVFDGTKLAQNFYGQPVDYWGTDKGNDPNNRYDENEDRIYSDKPYIEPISRYVTAIHVHLDRTWNTEYKYMEQYRTIRDLSATYGFPCFFYDDLNAWKLQNTAKAVKGLQPPAPSKLQSINELFTASLGDQLSKDADDLRYGLNFGGEDLQRSVEADIHNSRNSGKSPKLHVDELISNMRKNKLKTLPEVFEFLAKKFKVSRS